jgi:peptide chain release factor 1
VFESVDALIAEYAELQEKLGDPAVHADAGLSKKLNRRFAELSKIIAAHEKMTALTDDLAAAKEFASEDESLAAEVPAYGRGAGRGNREPSLAPDPQGP